jgi:hypothetical protein
MDIKHGMGDTVSLRFFITDNGLGVTGETPTVSIKKRSTGEWMDDTKIAWLAGYNDIAMAEIDATNQAGAYGIDITHIDSTSEEYEIYFQNTGTYVGSDFEVHEFTGEVYVPASSSYATGTIRGLLDTMRNKDISRAFDQTTDSLEAIRDNWTANPLLTGDRAITFQLYETATTTPIADVAISIYNSDQSLFLGGVITDTNGQWTVGLDDGTYKLVFRKAGVIFTVPDTLVVTADATPPFYGTPLVISAPADPDVCRVYEYLFLPDGVTKPTTVSANAVITKLPYDIDGKLHSGVDITEVYDSVTGLIYWDIVQGATVRFAVENFIEASKVIPGVSTKRLSEI